MPAESLLNHLEPCNSNLTYLPSPLCLYRALLSAESLLDHLEPGDSGSDSPSPATAHQLRRAGLSPLRQYIAAGQLGKPYLWAQRLAGLEFVPGEQVRMGRIDEMVSAAGMVIASEKCDLADQFSSLVCFSCFPFMWVAVN